MIGIFLLLGVALAFSPLGLGGGVLFVPIFHYLLGWSIEDALLGSLGLVFMVALGSSMSHSKGGHADKIVASVGRKMAIPGAVVGSIIASLLIKNVDPVVIKILAAIILAFVIERTLTRMRREANGSTIEVNVSEQIGKYRLGTSLAGIASGLLGIGGGAILVTLHRSLLGMDAHKAAGTSYLIGATIVPVALVSHIIIDGTLGVLVDRIGLLPMILIPALAFCCSFFGAKYAIQYVPKRVVTNTFLVAVSLSLMRYLYDFSTYIL
jgi:hypothetical protein